MDISSALGARRICYLAGRPYWIPPLSFGGWADLVSWLDEDFILPGRAEREGRPRVSDDASRDALSSPLGQQLLVWLGLRDQGVSYEDAGAILAESTDAERSRLYDVLFERRRTASGIGGEDIGETWLGPAAAELAASIGMDAVRRLSLDQVEFLLSGGECDKHQSPGEKAARECHRIFLEQQAERKAAGAAAGPAPADDDPNGDEAVHRRWAAAVEADRAAKEGAKADG